MAATSLKIDNKKYRIIPEEDYLALMQDINDLKKVLKRRSETGVEAHAFFENIAKKKTKSAL